MMVDWIRQIIIWNCGHQEMIEDMKIYRNQHGCYVVPACNCSKGSCEIQFSVYKEIKDFFYDRDCLCG